MRAKEKQGKIRIRAFSSAEVNEFSHAAIALLLRRQGSVMRM